MNTLSTSKTLLFLLLFISTTAIFHSCVKEQDFFNTPSGSLDSTEGLSSFDPDEIIITSIFGSVVDENDIPIANSEVTLNTIKGFQTTTTDGNGNFLYSNVMVVKEGALLKVVNETTWSFDAFKKLSLTENNYNYTKIKLLDKRYLGELPSMEGGLLEDDASSAKIELPPNSVRQKNGESYVGDIRVIMSWIDPTAEDLASRMIGNLSGIDKNGREVALGTFGMLSVELRGENWAELQMKEGMPATLSFPVPIEILNEAPPTIPLWSFDEELGTWIEEGSATLQDGFYVGEVAHFSFWNVDTKTDPISVKGEVFVRVNEEDMEAPYLQVYVDIEGWQVVGGYLDDSGEFEFYNFPANTPFTLSVLDACGGVLWEEELGPYASGTDLETIIVQSTESNFVTVSGSGLNCDGNPVEKGFVEFKLNKFFSSHSFYPLNKGGTFEFVANVCEATQGELSIIDIENARKSFPENIEFSNTSISLAPLSVCVEMDAFMNIDSDIGGIYIVELEAFVNGENNISIRGSDVDYFYHAELYWDDVMGEGVYTDATLSLIEWDVGYLYSVTVEITEFGENPGDVVIGTFFSVEENMFGDTVSGNFKAIRQ